MMRLFLCFLFFQFIGLTGNSQYGCALLNYVKNKDLQRVKSYSKAQLEQQINCFKSNEWMSPLMLAAASDQFEMLDYLLQNGADIHQGLSNKTVIDHCHSPAMKTKVKQYLQNGEQLVKACAKGNLEKIGQLLLDKGFHLKLYDKDGHCPITAAAENGQLEVLKLLLSRGAQIDQVWRGYHFEKTALQLAAEHGHFDCVQFLVESKANIDGNLKQGYTPLNFALSNGHTPIALYLIEHGASINLPIKDGVNPVSMAAYKGNTEVVKHMISTLESKGDSIEIDQNAINGALSSGNKDVFDLLIEQQALVKPIDPSFLVKACEGKNLTLVKLLVEDYEADLDAQDSYKFTPLTTAAARDGSEHIIKYLLENGADPDKPGHAGYVALGRAVYFPTYVKLLLEAGANPNYGQRYTQILEMACQSNKVETLKLLIEYGIQIAHHDICPGSMNEALKTFIQKHMDWQKRISSALDIKDYARIKLIIQEGANSNIPIDRRGNSLLMKFATERNLDMVQFLINSGANVNRKNALGKSALIQAIEEKSNLAIVKYLLSHGASFEQTDRNNAPLFIAVQNNNLEYTQALIQAGADIQDKLNPYQTPIILHAAQHANLVLIKYLVSKGASPNNTDQYGNLAINVACQKNTIDVVRYFVEVQKQDPNHIGSNTALQYATSNNNLQLMAYLLSKGADPYLAPKGQRNSVQNSAMNAYNKPAFDYYLDHDYVFADSIDANHSFGAQLYASKNMEALIRLVEQKKINVNYHASSGGHSLLQLAVASEDFEFAELLLKNGADPNIQDAYKQSLFQQLIKKNANTEFAKILINYGYDLNQKDYSQKTALMHACAHGNLAWVDFLFFNGADPNETNDKGINAFMMIRSESGTPLKNGDGSYAESTNLKILKRLRLHKFDVTAKDQKGFTLLMAACQASDYSLIKYILEKTKLDINAKTEYNWSAISFVLSNMMTPHKVRLDYIQSSSSVNDPIKPQIKDILKLMIDEGADLDISNSHYNIYSLSKSSNHSTKGHLAFKIIEFFPELFDLLITKIDPKLEVDHVNLLEVAVHFKRDKIARQLVQLGVPIYNTHFRRYAYDLAEEGVLKEWLKEQ